MLSHLRMIALNVIAIRVNYRGFCLHPTAWRSHGECTIAIMIGDPPSNAGMSTGTFLPSICLHLSVEFGTRHKNGNQAIIYGQRYSNRFIAFNQLSMPSKVTIRNARNERARVGQPLRHCAEQIYWAAAAVTVTVSVAAAAAAAHCPRHMMTRGPGESIFFSQSNNTQTHIPPCRKTTHSSIAFGSWAGILRLLPHYYRGIRPIRYIAQEVWGTII